MPIIGIDPAADRLGVSVVTDDGRETAARVVSNRPAGWTAIWAMVDESTSVAIEGTRGWGLALALFLSDRDIGVIDVAPWRVAQLRDAGPTRRKTDQIDAFFTARAAQLADLEPAKFEATDVELSAAVTYRGGLVREQTARANRIHSLLGRIDPAIRDTLRRIRSLKQWTTLTTYDHPKHLVAACTIRDQAAAGVRSWHEIKLLTATIESLLPEPGRRLAQLAGIGPVGAALIVARTGDIGRFRSEAAFASFLGVVPTQHASGNRNRLFNNRHGERQLANVLNTAIKTQLRTQGEAWTYVNRRVKEGTPRPIAIIAARRKLARRTWKTLKT